MNTHTATDRTGGRDEVAWREAASASWLPWLTGRAIVLAALAVAKFEVSHFHISDPKAVADAHAGLLSWDAGWYANLATHGYRAVGTQGLRFFPLLPALASALHHITFLPVDAVTVLVSNASGLAATVALYLLARSEFEDPEPARSAAWLFNLVPAAFVMVMGYSDSLLILLAVVCFACLRHQRWLYAAGLGFLAGTARPIGCLLLIPALCEAVRGLRGTAWGQRAARTAAVLGPAAGLLAYLSWTSAEFGSFTRPLTLQTEPTRHGGLTDPLVTLYHDAVNLAGVHHVGTDLHLPWVLVTVGLLVIVFKRLPPSYGLFSLAVVAVAATGSNLDSFERYALSAFPLLMGAATLLRSRRVEVVVLVLCAVTMFGYALLAFLGAYVP
ncbi:MAG: mannosyltransferase family protein [Acidimicrobiales bacterium]